MEQNVKADKNIGLNIRAARSSKRITQEHLAAQMQLLGCDISRGTLAKIESGIRHISVEELNAIKTILDMTYDEMFSK